MVGWGCDGIKREGGSGTQKFVYQKWPDQIFPIVILFFPAMVPLVLGGGEGGHKAMVGSWGGGVQGGLA